MRKTAFTAFLLLTTSLSANSQELPSVADLQGRLTTALPSFWEIAEFRVIASALQGDPINPQALVRFEADVAPRSDLFSATGERAGPFAIIVSTYEIEQARTVFGTMRLDYEAGQWSDELNIENPVGNLGQPRGMFADPTLILGSEEQSSMLAILRDDTVAAASVRLDAEIDALQSERDQRIAALETKFLQQSNDLAAQRKATADDYTKELAMLEAEYEARVAELRKTYDPQVAAEEKRLADEITRLRGAHGETLDTMKLQQAAEIEKLHTTHATRVGELKAQQAQMVAELEAGITAKKERLGRQLAEAEEILAFQVKIVAAMETAADNDAYMNELMAQSRELQLEFMKSFGTTLSGSVNCKSAKERRLDLSFPVVFSVSEVKASGLIGIMDFGDHDFGIGHNEDEKTGTLTLATGAGELPRQFNLAMDVPVNGNGMNTIPRSYLLKMSENGAMLGSREGRISHSSARQSDGTCSVTLGAY